MKPNQSHTFAIEYDGSLVCDGVVIAQPCAEFPRSAIAQLVRNDTAVPELLKELRTAGDRLAIQNGPQLSGWLAEIDAAIAKAKGRI